MIKEYMYYFMTPCDPVFRKMGYLNELIATYTRAVRVKKYWRDHLKNCQDAIDQAIRICPERRKVVVLGAGNLLDIPIDKLAFKFVEVVLVDIACLPVVRKVCQKYANVKWCFYDITGVADALLNFTAGDQLPQVSVSLPVHLLNCDLLISANVLSQLACCPSRWLVKNNVATQEIKRLEKELISAHLQVLQQAPGIVCLISDTQHRYLNQKGQLILRHNIFERPPAISPDHSWTWTIAPIGEINRTIQMIASVSAWTDWM